MLACWCAIGPWHGYQATSPGMTDQAGHGVDGRASSLPRRMRKAQAEVPPAWRVARSGAHACSDHVDLLSAALPLRLPRSAERWQGLPCAHALFRRLRVGQDDEPGRVHRCRIVAVGAAKRVLRATETVAPGCDHGPAPDLAQLHLLSANTLHLALVAELAQAQRCSWRRTCRRRKTM